MEVKNSKSPATSSPEEESSEDDFPCGFHLVFFNSKCFQTFFIMIMFSF